MAQKFEDMFAKAIRTDILDKMSKEELEVLAKILDIKNEKKPDWYGISGIKFIWHNAWSPAEIQYKGKVFQAEVVEDTMWERFRTETGSEDNDEFAKYMKSHKDEVYELCDLVLT